MNGDTKGILFEAALFVIFVGFVFAGMPYDLQPSSVPVGSNTGPCECGHGFAFHPASDSGRHCTHKWCSCPGFREEHRG